MSHRPILSYTIYANIIQKVSEEEPNVYTLIKLALVCKKWASTLVPQNFGAIKSGSFERIIRLATRPIISSVVGARECRFVEIQLLRPTNKINGNAFQQLSNGRLLAFVQRCQSLRSLSLYNYSLENEVNFGGSMSEVLRTETIQLQRLELMNMDLVSNGATQIISSLRNNAILTELNLSRNFLKEKDGLILGDTIRHNSTITKLDISFNEFRISGLKSIIEALQHNTTITELNLEAVCRLDCMITGFTLSSPPLTPTSNSLMLSSSFGGMNINSPATVSNNILLTVNAGSFGGPSSLLSNISPSSNHLFSSTPPLFSSISDHFASNNPTNWVPSSPSSISMNTRLVEGLVLLKNNKNLRTLNLSHNTFGKLFNNSLGDMISANTSITSLFLNYLKLDDECGAKIGRSLRSNKSITTLSLIYNQLGKEAGFEIAYNLSTNSTIRSLYLSNNLLNEEIGTEMGTMLRTNTTLTTLDVSDNNIGANGAKHIIEGLKVNSTLTRLMFRNNKIADNAGTYFASMLKENRTLRHLDISANLFQTNAGMLISMALESNSTLRHLNMQHNQLLEPSNNSEANIKRAAQSMQSLFVRNKALLSFDLEGNSVPDNSLKDIHASLLRNLSLLTTKKKKKKLFNLIK
eukprot:gene15483-18386_t